MTIASMKQQGSSVRAMARTLGRPASTVSRELTRNTCSVGSRSARADARLRAHVPSCTLKARRDASYSPCWNGSGRPRRSQARSSACGPTIQYRWSVPSSVILITAGRYCPRRRDIVASTPSHSGCP
ncbi:helix-turn-helix domain-containing protein [Paraburkholderia sp. 5N]|uniref:Helix-turn-helix domain-containing protein n=2 Tax=Paraburkholderia elongata TaxID=2675747 RepID=A0A972NSK9_9BURK|nr:helix-turn-helix domain-containing protein [Paraburkholderia elongata]